MDELKIYIKQKMISKEGIYNKNTANLFWHTNHGSEEMFNNIFSRTSSINIKSFSERIYCVLNDITSQTTCKICNNLVTFKNLEFGYREYCSTKCAKSDSKTTSKMKQTKLEKYGSESYVNPDKAKETKLEKYGSENYVNIEKCKQTKLEKYGSENYNNINKMKETKLEKYGSENYVNPDKAKETCLIKYGVSNPSQVKAIQDLKIQNSIDRYGCLFQQKHLKNIEFLSNIEYLETTSIEKIYEDTNISQSHLSKILIKNNIRSGSRSGGEESLLMFIKEIYTGEILTNKRKMFNNKETDIFIPEFNLGIEYNGNYFHSVNAGTAKNYHIDKTNNMNALGYELIHVFEHQWMNTEKREILKSIISHKLNKSKKIYARNTIFGEVSSKEAFEFLEKNHIQGGIRSKYYLGLYNNEELIQIFTLGKSRYKDEYEIHRICTKLNYAVIGGVSKLFSKVKNYITGELITFADLSYSSGNIYETLNMNLLYKTSPSYYYVKNNIKYNRITFQKHKLKNKLKSFNETLSESDNVMNNGYLKIYDCGQAKYSVSINT